MAPAWYYALNGEQKGPVTTEELKNLVASRQLSLNDLIWKKGLAEWVKVGRVRELAALVQATSSQTAETQPETTVQAAAKNVAQPQTPKESPPSEELRLVPEFDEPKESQKQQIPQKTEPSAQEVAPQAKSAQNPKQYPAPKPQSTTNIQPAQWYYTQNGQQQGPVTARFLKEKALSGELLPTDHLWKEGLKDWVAASALPGLKFPTTAASQTVQTSQPTTQPVAATPVVATPVETDEPFGAPDANSIFDIMNDPSYAAAPAATAEKPNAGLATMPSEKKKKKVRNRTAAVESDNGITSNIQGGLWLLFLLGVACMFFVFGIWHYFYMNELRENGVATQGTVIEVDKSRPRRSLTFYYRPTVSFTTQDGQHYTVKTDSSTDERVVGEKVSIIYLSRDPNRAEIEGSDSFSIFNPFFFAGIAFLCSTAWYWFKWNAAQ